MGCLIGYAATVSNTMDVQVAQKKDKESWYYGGYYIYSVPFKAGLYPNDQLVYDVKDTDEKWLVNYNEGNKFFPCDLIGMIIPDKMTVTPVLGAVAKIEQVFVCQITAPEVKMNKSDIVKKGFYRFKLDKAKVHIFDIEEISKKEFDEQKSLKATMLNLKEPAFTKW